MRIIVGHPDTDDPVESYLCRFCAAQHGFEAAFRLAGRHASYGDIVAHLQREHWLTP